MPPPSLLSAAPAPLALERRRWTALFSLPFALVLVASGLTGLRWLPLVLGNRPGWIVGALYALAAVALALSIGRSAWQALTAAGPALLVDTRGITDRFHLHTQVPWSAILATSLDYGDGNSLVLRLRAGATLADGQVVRDTWGRAARRLLAGGDLTIPLGGLVYDHAQLREALAAHLAHARRSGTPSVA
jgi:hypothetical protein